MALLRVSLRFLWGTLFCFAVSRAQQQQPDNNEQSTFRIVQLGDSYSAGNGARDATGDFNYDPFSTCKRSPTNWGSQFAETLRSSHSKHNITYVNKACSDGTAVDLNPEDDVDELVDLVLITTGGIDLGFQGIIGLCYVVRGGDPCEEILNSAMSNVDTLGEVLIQKLVEMGERMKDSAQLILVSYPFLAPDVPDVLDGFDVSQGLRDFQLAGDVIQMAAVKAANIAVGRDFAFFYNGTKDVFAGHEPDPELLVTNPDGWIWEVDFALDLSEWYHPNPEGQRQLAMAISEFFQDVVVAGSTLISHTGPNIQNVIDFLISVVTYFS